MQEQRRRDEQLNCTVEPSTVPGPFPRKCSLACAPRNHTEAHGSVHGASPERIQTLLFQVHVAQLPFMGAQARVRLCPLPSMSSRLGGWRPPPASGVPGRGDQVLAQADLPHREASLHGFARGLVGGAALNVSWTLPRGPQAPLLWTGRFFTREGL